MLQKTPEPLSTAISSPSWFAYCAVLVLLFCSSCSPTQGYPGPRLPEEQVSQLFVEDTSQDQEALVRITLDGVAFDTSGVEVLPGIHDIDAYQERLGRKRNCRPEQRFDRSSYESCLWRERSQRNRRKGGIWFPCSMSDYTSTVYHCLVQVTNSDCHLSAETKAGKKYLIRLTPADPVLGPAPLPGKNQQSAVIDKETKEKVGTGECQQVLTHEEQREFSSPSP